MRNFLLLSVIVLVVIFLGSSIQWVSRHGLHRPYWNWDTEALAKHLIEKGLSPERCFDLVWYQIGQQEGEAQAECVYFYAKLSKDPFACAQIMPSSYGWDCLGQAEKPNARLCWFDFNEKTQIIHGKRMPECGSGDKALADRCCAMGKDVYVDDVNSCEGYSDAPPFYDQCLELVAKRDKNLELCTDIQDENIRSSCQVAVRALEKTQ